MKESRQMADFDTDGEQDYDDSDQYTPIYTGKSRSVLLMIPNTFSLHR
jgi:hypothetical protein